MKILARVLLLQRPRGSFCLWNAHGVSMAIDYRDSGNCGPLSEGKKALDDVIEFPGVPLIQPVRREGGLKMSPGKVTIALRHHIYGIEAGDM